MSDTLIPAQRSEVDVERDIDAIAENDEVWEYTGSKTQPSKGLIVKIGPKLVHVQRHGRTTAYHRTTFRRRDGYPGGFWTLARRADMDARGKATQTLREHGVGVEFFRVSGWTTDRLVGLAAFVTQLHPMPEEIKS